MLDNAKWHYDHSRIDGKPILPRFGLFWNCCINSPSPEGGQQRVVTMPHADSKNVAALFCALLPFWEHGEDEWSWLVLWDLGIVLQCPRGAFVLYPSALLLHFNVRIVKYGFDAEHASATPRLALPQEEVHGLREEIHRLRRQLAERDYELHVVTNAGPVPVDMEQFIAARLQELQTPHDPSERSLANECTASPSGIDDLPGSTSGDAGAPIMIQSTLPAIVEAGRADGECAPARPERLYTGAGDAIAGENIGFVLEAATVEGDAEDRVVVESLSFDQRAEAYGLRVASLDEMLGHLPTADSSRPSAYILYQASSGFRVPLPVGRYGNPFLKGWLWGEIDSRRLFGATERQGRILNNSKHFKQLAAEAVQLPFAFRSMAQRLVVSWALRNQTLPLPGWAKEVDILFECKHNPNQIPFSVRRQHSISATTSTIYTEWDVLDLDCYLVYRAARPKVQTSRARGGDDRLDWPAVVRAAITFGTRCSSDCLARERQPEYSDGPQAYSGSGHPAHVFEHLRRCGLHEERLTSAEGDFRLFMDRYAAVDAERRALQAQFRATYGKTGQDKEQAWIDAHRACPAIPEGRPVLRIANDFEWNSSLALGPDGLVRGVEIETSS
ncbi:hypothetical protein AURDEDRAFT_175959 [Auricularia subglabra TFB-10046 SS5]|nr:hypothetical protein AURDEDRAFT_175959 [Auricularia subglabra TFB-10046 SS5]